MEVKAFCRDSMVEYKNESEDTMSLYVDGKLLGYLQVNEIGVHFHPQDPFEVDYVISHADTCAHISIRERRVING